MKISMNNQIDMYKLKNARNLTFNYSLPVQETKEYFVCLGIFVPLYNFSLMWRLYHYQ